jgi:hypothetical protein
MESGYTHGDDCVGEQRLERHAAADAHDRAAGCHGCAGPCQAWLDRPDLPARRGRRALRVRPERLEPTVLRALLAHRARPVRLARRVWPGKTARTARQERRERWERKGYPGRKVQRDPLAHRVRQELLARRERLGPTGAQGSAGATGAQGPQGVSGQAVPPALRVRKGRRAPPARLERRDQRGQEATTPSTRASPTISCQVSSTMWETPAFNGFGTIGSLGWTTNGFASAGQTRLGSQSRRHRPQHVDVLETPATVRVAAHHLRGRVPHIAVPFHVDHASWEYRPDQTRGVLGSSTT